MSHRSVELLGAVGVEGLERDVDRAGKVLVGVLGLGQHVDQLRARQSAQPVGDRRGSCSS
jgi:hypothetical protein